LLKSYKEDEELLLILLVSAGGRLGMLAGLALHLEKDDNHDHINNIADIMI